MQAATNVDAAQAIAAGRGDAAPLVNVARRLAMHANERPAATAIAVPLRGREHGRRRYRSITFRELDQVSDRLARGLRELGVTQGTRLALLVRPGIDFVSLVFALLKSGAVAILIDPGMGRKNLLGCLEAARPEGFVAIPLAQAMRTVFRRKFPASRIHVTVGRRLFWGGVTIDQLRGGPWSGPEMAPTTADDPAAIIFTTGSTGPPKGVLYTHQTFERQAVEIREQYDIRPGEIDVPCFPLFGLFNSAMGVTSVIPDMDASRPASADPATIVEHIVDWQATQAFASPAVWDRVAEHCSRTGARMPALRRVLSAGAAVPPRVLAGMRQCIAPDGEMHTPYGATEALPLATISASEVLSETETQTRRGAGTCVGRRFGGIEWKVIRLVANPKAPSEPLPIANIAEVEELPPGEIGELIVRGAVVTREYVTRVEANATAKIADGDAVWHRLGDVGYLDQRDRFWYCGRMAHRVVTRGGTLFTEPCEAIFCEHPAVRRAALVGVSEPKSADEGRNGAERRIGCCEPVAICELRPGMAPPNAAARDALFAELRALGQANPLTASIERFLLHPRLPVDIRHNAKIFREQLAVWAAEQLGREPRT